jgi:hypothetical protein
VVANAIRHAGLRPDDRVTLSARLREDFARVEVSDLGPGFDPEKVKTRCAGLQMLGELASRWRVVCSDRRLSGERGGRQSLLVQPPAQVPHQPRLVLHRRRPVAPLSQPHTKARRVGRQLPFNPRDQPSPHTVNLGSASRSSRPHDSPPRTMRGLSTQRRHNTAVGINHAQAARFFPPSRARARCFCRAATILGYLDL